jgi:hypothetical protein
MSVRRFDTLVFGGLLAVCAVLGVIAIRDSRERDWGPPVYKNVWKLTIPKDASDLPLPALPEPDVQEPTRVPPPDTTTPLDTVSLLPMTYQKCKPSDTVHVDLIDGSVELQWWMWGTFPCLGDPGLLGHTSWTFSGLTRTYDSFDRMTVGNIVGSGHHLTAALRTRSVYQPPWMLTDNYPGRAVYNLPKEMVQGVWKRVTVRIALEGTDLEDWLGRPIPPPWESFKTKVSRVMSVKLSGETFSVKSIASEVQPMGDGPTEWPFDVQPQETGPHDLTLAVARILPVGELGKQTRTYPPETRTITVTINPAWSTKRFFGAHWDWVASSLVIPFFVWGFAKFRREKKRRAGFLSSPSA